MERAVIVHHTDTGEIKCYSSVKRFIDDYPSFKRGTVDNYISRESGGEYEKDGIRVLRVPVISYPRRRKEKAIAG